MVSATHIPAHQPEDFPDFDPAVWKRDDVFRSANCYAFAANDPHGHVGTYGPQPGDRHFQYLREITVREVSEKAEIDGFIPAGKYPSHKPGHYLVALAVCRNHDYHWYRQMPDGTWWHKPAPGKPLSNRDYDGKVITDPRQANRRNKRYEYRQFGGFFHVPKAGLKVGITPDREILREYEFQEVIELTAAQREARSKHNITAMRQDREQFQARKAELDAMRPRGPWHQRWRQAGQMIQDGFDRLLRRPLQPRPDPDALLTAFSDSQAERARRQERHLRKEEMGQLRDLIERQQMRAEAGFRPTEAMLKFRIARQKGQRHAYAVASDVADGLLQWANATKMALVKVPPELAADASEKLASGIDRTDRQPETASASAVRKPVGPSSPLLRRP